MDSRIEKTLANLKKNNFDAFYAENSEQAIEIIRSLLPNGCTVSVGGSVTLQQIGAIDLLKSGTYNFLDRSAAGLTPDDVRTIYQKGYSGDFFLCSSNAVTENGELYNVDGNGNRVSQLCYGAGNVILAVGVNKIVKDYAEAVMRVKTVAAPKNAVRLGLKTYCSENGKCASVAAGNGEKPCEGCRGENRICSHYLLSGWQRNADRIKVILINEDLGY